MRMGIFRAFHFSPDFLLVGGNTMGFFDEENRVIMREFLDDADFYEDGDLEDDGLINLSRYSDNVSDDLDAGDAPELEGEDR